MLYEVATMRRLVTPPSFLVALRYARYIPRRKDKAAAVHRWAQHMQEAIKRSGGTK